MSDWIDWQGGECPVAADAVVEVRFRDGNTFNHLAASKWTWEHPYRAHGDDIVAYRVLPPSPTIADLAAKDAEIERLRMQLAACGVAAMQNTPGVFEQRITKDNPYWSESYGDVCRAVDREMSLRAELAQARDALTIARGCIEIDRTTLLDSHSAPDGTLDDDARAALEDYDGTLVQIDAAIKGKS